MKAPEQMRGCNPFFPDDGLLLQTALGVGVVDCYSFEAVMMMSLTLF